MEFTLKKWMKKEEEQVEEADQYDDEYDLFDEDEDDGSVYSALIRMSKEEFAREILRWERVMAERFIDLFRETEKNIKTFFRGGKERLLALLIDAVAYQFLKEPQYGYDWDKTKWLDSPWDNKYIDVETDDMKWVVFERAFEKLDKPSIFEATRKMTKGELALFDSYVQGQMIPVVAKAFRDAFSSVAEMFSEEEKTIFNTILIVAEKGMKNFNIINSVGYALDWYRDPWE